MIQPNNIYCMDCIEGMKMLPNGSVDLIVTDPPYNFESEGGGFVKRENKEYIKKVNNSFGTDFNPDTFLNEIPRLFKNGINLYVWCNKTLIPKYLEFAKSQGCHFDLLTWHKKNPVPLWNNKYISDTEYLIYIKSPGAYFNSKLPDWRKYRKYFITNIAEEKNNHPSPKPLICMKNPIEVSSKKHDIILDPFMGSGTAAVACVQLERLYVGFEINKEYCQLAKRRLQQVNITNYFS